MTRHVVDCDACGRESTVIYRCEHCGHDLTDQTVTAGREQV